ncbi:Jun dimerization protein 2 [Myotis brandtii]|uniref:Jun dimerization protein 2 n=1 Tax=Myotis brandtii TaxID=109478 RepID=S7NSH8_MYOBR|nr:Jun dimerization protein 2 [Myotis brandtii]
MNAELKTQMEELKQEWQQLILMLNWYCPTCIIRTDRVKIPDSESNPTAGAAREEVTMG